MALNRIVVMGRLVADPEVRTIGDDLHVTTVRIAVDHDRPNKETGEREADFLDVVAWRGTCDFLARNFAKGDQVVVDGRLQSRNWTDKDGNKRYSVEIVAENIYFGGSKRAAAQAVSASDPAATAEVSDEDLPF